MASPYRRRLVGVSTKMYFNAARTRGYVDEVVRLATLSPELLDKVDVFVIPDHLTLASVARQLDGTKILPGAQDAFFEDAGPFTGEASPAVLAELGCRLVELGHAERRRLFGETDDETARKAAAAVRNGMVPLVCIGEPARYEPAAAVDACRVQVEAVMAALPRDAEVVLAYEPVWAIGAREPADADYIVEVARGISALSCVQKRSGLTRILYGGSAGPGLFEKLKEGVDGLFLGRFAHEPAQFLQTIREVASA